MAVPWCSITDEVDLRNASRAIAEQARLHEAAGAREILAAASAAPVWRSGDDLGDFITAAQRIPLRAGGWKLFSAHQMGSCRMGDDPSTSVAGPWGEDHDHGARTPQRRGDRRGIAGLVRVGGANLTGLGREDLSCKR